MQVWYRIKLQDTTRHAATGRDRSWGWLPPGQVTAATLELAVTGQRQLWSENQQSGNDKRSGARDTGLQTGALMEQ